MARRQGLTLSGLLLLSMLSLSAPAAFADDPTGAPAATEPATQAPPATEPPPATQEPPATEAPPATVPAQPAQTTPAEPAQPVAPAQPATPATTDQPTIIISPGLTGNSAPVWPWALAGLGALILIGGIIWFARSASHRTDEAAVWRSRRLSAYAEGAALHDAVLSAIPGQGRPADEAQWAEVQRRANDFTQRLYQLRETAPDEDGQLRTEQVLASLQTLRSAMDSERAAGPVHGMTADITRERLNDFRVALYALRDDPE